MHREDRVFMRKGSNDKRLIFGINSENRKRHKSDLFEGKKKKKKN